MTTVKIKGLDKVKANIKNTFEKVRKDPALLLEIGEQLQKDVVANARAGRGPDGQKFRALSASWVDKTRKYLQKYNATDEFFQDDRKARLTFTGKFLRSIIYRINQSEGLAIVEPQGQHPGYKTKSGNTKSISNQKLAEYLRENGFDFLYASKAFRKRTVVTVKRFLRRLISKK